VCSDLLALNPAAIRIGTAASEAQFQCRQYRACDALPQAEFQRFYHAEPQRLRFLRPIMEAATPAMATGPAEDDRASHGRDGVLTCAWTFGSTTERGD
jgi:hypothetical protein